MSSAPVMLMVKDFMLLACGALSQNGYQVGPIEVRRLQRVHRRRLTPPTHTPRPSAAPEPAPHAVPLSSRPRSSPHHPPPCAPLQEILTSGRGKYHELLMAGVAKKVHSIMEADVLGDMELRTEAKRWGTARPAASS
jgi:hypothetical protein